MLLLDKSILTHPSIATFCYAKNVCGINLLIFGHPFSVSLISVFFILLLLSFNPRPYRQGYILSNLKKRFCQTFLNGFHCIFSRRFQICQIPFEILHI